MLITGTVFQAVDKLNRKYVYEFNGVKLNDNTGCSYINLHNLTTNTWTDVEYAWFKEREITIISNGMIVKNNNKKAKIINVRAGISNFLSVNNLEVLTTDKKNLSEGTEIWSWKNTEIAK